MKSLVIDLARCNGCYNCQVACKDEHVENDWTPYSKPQPDIGQFWMKVEEIERGTVPKVKLSYIPQPCMHCDNAPCISACPVPGAIKRRPDGIVIIDPHLCNGSRKCVQACPYGAIYFNEELHIAQKCTMCAHLLDKGWKEPRCVESCPTQVLKFGEYEDLKNLIGKAEVLHPEYETKPIVFYLGLPKKFIAGALVDEEDDECLEEADVTATDLTTAKTHKTRSDNFGDFWLEGLEANHRYSLKIEKPGYSPKIIDAISTEEDVNLGDIFVLKKRG